MAAVHILAVAAATFGMAQAIPYTIAILKRRTKPSQLTAIVWSVVGTVQAVAMLASGAGGGAALNVAFALTSYITLALSFKYGLRNRAVLDVPLAILAGASLVAWAIVGPKGAIVLAASVIVTGYVSCIAKLWRHPGTEDALAWLLTTAGALCSLVVLAMNGANAILFVPPIVTTVGSSAVLLVTAIQAHQARMIERAQRVLTERVQLASPLSVPVPLVSSPTTALAAGFEHNEADVALAAARA